MTSFSCKVIDSGKGVNQSDLEKIFHPLFGTKFDTELKLDKKIFGLGLNLSRNLIKKLGGEIVLNPKIGKGCNF